MAAYEADIQAKVSADARRWKATNECDPQHTTAGPSMAFCSEIATLRAKLAEARRRDELDAKIAAIDATAGETEVVTSVDPFADNIADFLAVFGLKLSDETKHALAAQKDVTRSLSLEILAMFGPSAWLLLINAMLAPRQTPVAPAPATPARREKPVSVAPAPVAAMDDTPLVPMDDPFHAFVAERLEDANGAVMKAGDPWQMWLRWCVDNKHEPGSQKAFGGKMKSRFAWEPNNNRPRYLNVRAKVPALRLVSTA